MDYPQEQKEVKPFHLHRRRESVTAAEILEWIKQQPEGSGWMATVKGINLATDEICR